MGETPINRHLDWGAFGLSRLFSLRFIT